MNKDVIYIEPDDDITDIISALESTKEKIVAIVPPKKSAVLKSIINIKLISKTGAAAGKTVVLVTTDPATMKLAAAVKMPVTKDLQSAPSIPKEEDLPEEVTEEVIEEEVVEEKPEEEAVEENQEEESEEDKEVKEVIEENKKAKAEKAEKSEKKAEEKAKKEPTNPVAKWFVKNKKLAIIGGSALAALVLFLVWAFVIAPSVSISIAIRTDSNNFSELISFTNDQTKEDAENGVFYLEEFKKETTQKVEFKATGEKNVGKKATGEVIAYIYTHNENDPVAINAGTAFTANSVNYYSDNDATLVWNGKTSECANITDLLNYGKYGCQLTVRIPVTAAYPGVAYNIPMTDENGWTTNGRVNVYTDAPITGGTDEKVSVVTKGDIEKAVSSLTTNSNETTSSETKEPTTSTNIKQDLIDEIGEDKLIIESSFKQTVADPESTPKIDEEVKEGVTPSVTVKTTVSIFAIDKTKVEDFIAKKAKLADDQKIYSFKDPFIENFLAIENGYTGKLKTTYYTGAKVTENDILELAKGRGLGDIQHDIKSKYSGISNIVIDKSFPWVNSAPGDTNKITINLEIEDKNSKE